MDCALPVENAMGSRMYEPPKPMPGCIHVPPGRLVRVTNASARLSVSRFISSGSSSHSGGASTLHIILNHCHRNGVPYELAGQRGAAFVVTKLTEARAGRLDDVTADAPQRVLDLLTEGKAFEATYVPGVGTKVVEKPSLLRDEQRESRAPKGPR